MSTIRKKPFIETVIGSLNDTQLKALKYLVDNPTVNVSYSVSNMPSENGIYGTNFVFKNNQLYSSILIKTDNYVVLISYNRFQELRLFKIVEGEIIEIKEYLDINELRRILDDYLDNGEDTGKFVLKTVTPNQIYGTDNSGQQKTYEGTNEALGETVVVRDANGSVDLKGFKLDKQGEDPKSFDYDNLLTKEEVQELVGELSAGINYKGTVSTVEDLPSSDLEAGDTYVVLADGSQWTWDGTDWIQTGAARVVDDELSDVSENPVQNKVITEELDKKANKNGNYPTMTTGLADNLTPYDDNSGAEQDEPFSYQGTGTANGTASDFATGSNALLKEKRGNTVVVNQLATDNSSALSIDENGILSLINNISSSIWGSAFTNGGFVATDGKLLDITHKYLIGYRYFSGTIGNNPLTFNNGNTSVSVFDLDSGNHSTIITGGSWYPRLSPKTSGNETDYNNLKFYLMVIDLTQWFNGDIPQDLLDHPENFFRYYQGSLAYNAGELVNANSRYIKCIGRNQWDEVTELGTIDTNTGANVSGTSNLRSKNYIRVIPNATYYFKSTSNMRVFEYDKDKNFIKVNSAFSNNTLQLQNTTEYIRFFLIQSYGTTYNHDITISIYYEGESGYDQYYPYEELTNTDTGSETLYGVDGSRDVKLPSGLITRVRKRYTFTGNETWEWIESWGAFRTFAITDAAAVNGNTGEGCTALLPGYEEKPQYSTAANKTNMTFVLNSGYHTANALGIINTAYGASDLDAFKAYIAGKTIEYPVAEPTTEQGTSFSPNLVIDDFGSMDFSGTSGVPQGNLIFYPVDYKAFVDTLYKYTDGTPSELVKQDDLTTEETARSNQDTILQNAIGGTLRQCLCVKETLDFDDTAVVDLGSLNWGYQGNGVFASNETISAIGVSGTNIAKALCTKYKNTQANWVVNGSVNKTITIYSNSKVYVCDTSYSSADTFKNAMKGVLLAYEKEN